MKVIWLSILLTFSSISFADDVAIERFFETKVAVLEAQISQLYSAISVLKTEHLSQESAFEKIAQPSFKAVDVALKNHGYTHSQFYRFADINKTAIKEWSTRNSDQVNLINQLTDERGRLMSEYDGLIGSLVPAKKGDE